MDAMVKRFERYVNTTAKLYNELEVLNQLENGKNKFKMHQHEESRKAFEQKVVWQIQEVRRLKDASLWNRTFDKVMEMVARTVCTLYSRICAVFGDTFARLDVFVSDSGRGSGMGPGRLLTECSNRASSVSGSKFDAFNDGFGNDSVRTDSVRVDGFNKFRDHEDYSFFNSGCSMGPGRLLMECLNRTGSVSGSKFDAFDDGSVKKCDDDQSSKVSGTFSVSSNVRKDIKNLKTWFKSDTKNKLLLQASEATVGGSALAQHYANVIIVIEKLLKYPHLVGEEARDDLYQMLPTSLRLALKTSLKSYVKDLSIYDAPIAHDWKDRLDGILGWLGPMAHNMIRWQNERNFEQQQIVSRTNVLLLQTLYFADRTKTEAAICELLVGLNYICRYEHQQNALLDCASSFDFEECVEWQTEY
ncbi:uncharacterized protein LOC143541894 [Bidens hawaiensis]|uniref:uncharacterized protein LOC143541894 n=1 Tax=Bidens hawaiensis TaxID=980011 RepID=UPI00404A96C5